MKGMNLFFLCWLERYFAWVTVEAGIELSAAEIWCLVALILAETERPFILQIALLFLLFFLFSSLRDVTLSPWIRVARHRYDDQKLTYPLNSFSPAGDFPRCQLSRLTNTILSEFFVGYSSVCQHYGKLWCWHYKPIELCCQKSKIW